MRKYLPFDSIAVKSLKVFENDTPIPPVPVDMVIDSEFTYFKPIVCDNLTITENGKIIVADQRVGVVIHATGTVTINGIIDVKGKGWESKLSSEVENKRVGTGYCDSGYDFGYTIGQYNHVKQTGGGAPATNRSSAYKSMLGLDSAVAGGFTAPYGPGTAGQNGGGGGGGSDGIAGMGGGTGAGGGGGSTGHGNYGSPHGGKGSQSDTILNLELFKSRQLLEIPLFGGGGGSTESGGLKRGGNGGGNIQIYAANVIINSTAILDASGENGNRSINAKQASGAGGGGSICIAASVSFTNKGTFNVNGGISASSSYGISGGSGGAGLILLDVV